MSGFLTEVVSHDGENIPLLGNEKIAEEFLKERLLLKSFKDRNVADFKDALKTFNSTKFCHDDFKDDGSNMDTVFYQILLTVPREDRFFDVLNEVFKIKKENCKLILDILLDLKFYSNFQKIVELNYNKKNSEIECINAHIAEILNVKNFDSVKIVNIQRLKQNTRRENIFKYFLDFHKKITEYVKNQHPSERLESMAASMSYDQDVSCFLQLVQMIVNDEDKKQFKTKFDEYIKSNKTYIGENMNFVVTAEARILIEIAFFCDYAPAFLTILNSTNININSITIRSEENKFLYEVLAHKGYYTLIENFQLGNSEILKKIYQQCLKGNICERNQEEVRKHIVNSNYDKLLDIIIDNKNFHIDLDDFNPMREAVECSNKYAVLKLIERNGLTDKFLENIKMEFLEHYLNSKVCDSKGAYTIDYQFMKQDSWIQLFMTFLENNDIKDLITHPVISIFIKYKSKQYIKLHILSLMIFLLMFVLPIGISFYFEDQIKFICWIVASVFLLLNFLSSRSNNDSGDNKTKSSMLFSLFALDVSLLDRSLLISTVIATVSLNYKYMFLHKIFFVIIVLAGSLKLMLLLSAVYRTLAIYLYMLWTVTRTFFKMASIFSFFVIAFTICFTESISLNQNGSSSDNNSTKDGISSATDKNSTHPFGSPGFHTLIKTTLMFAGEYEASELDYEDSWFLTALIGLFVLMAIILYNFVNALAISDVQILQQKAEFYDLRLKIIAMKKIQYFLNKIQGKKISIRSWCLRKIVPTTEEVISTMICELEGKKKIKKNKKSKNTLESQENKKIISIKLSVSKETYSELKGIIKRKLNVGKGQNFEKNIEILTFEISRLKKNLNENINGLNEKIKELGDKNDDYLPYVFKGINDLMKANGKLEERLEKKDQDIKVINMENKIEKLTELVGNLTKEIKSIDENLKSMKKSYDEERVSLRLNLQHTPVSDNNNTATPTKNGPPTSNPTANAKEADIATEEIVPPGADEPDKNADAEEETSELKRETPARRSLLDILLRRNKK